MTRLTTRCPGASRSVKRVSADHDQLAAAEMAFRGGSRTNLRSHKRTFNEVTLYPRLLAVLTVVTLALSPQPGASQQPSGFDPSRFDWTDPYNWDRSMTPSGIQMWTLRDQAARAYWRRAMRTGQYCNYSYTAGTRVVSLHIPKIS